MRLRVLVLCAGVAVVALVGCATTANHSAALPPTPRGAQALFSGTEIELARNLCLNKCVKCHNFYDPAKYNDVEWSKWMSKMNRKAKLDAAQAELLGRYLETFRHPPATNSTQLQNAAVRRQGG